MVAGSVNGSVVFWILERHPLAVVSRPENAARCLKYFPPAYSKASLSQNSKGIGYLSTCWRGIYVEEVKGDVAQGSFHEIASLCNQRL